jgi:multidrug efflux system outer membrane protein
MTFKHRLLAIVTAFLLFGCTMIPQYQRPIAPVAPAFAGSIDTPAATAAADLAWRDVFTDERLTLLIDLALANNLDLRVAALNVEQSRAQYEITRSGTFPAVNASGSVTTTSTSGATTDIWNASIGTTAYEIDFFGRVRSLNRQALESFLATGEAQRAAQISLVAEVAAEYFTLRHSQAQLELARQTLATVQATYTLNKALVDAGAISELDLRTSEAQVHTAEISVSTYALQGAQAEHYLVLLVGEPLPAGLPPPRSFTDSHLVADLPAGLPSELVERRPDILEAEHNLKAANASIGAARAAFFPSIQLTASAGTTSPEFRTLLGAGTGFWSFSPQITLPIFAGGKNRANLESAGVSMRIATANYQKAIQTAFREVADALDGTRGYADQLDTQALLTNSQQRRYDLATLRYRHGEDTYLNALLAQQDLYTAQKNQLSAQFNRLTSQVSLYKALGGGWK